MGDVTEYKRRFLSGLDADIPATGLIGDRYYATDKNKLYYWTGAGWKTGLGYEWVDRRVDGPDKQVGDFTTDGNWKVDGLDLSGIVPAGATRVHLDISITDDAALSQFLLRTNAVNIMNRINTATFVANIPVYKAESIAVDADRLLDYFGSNLAFATIDVTVVGWDI